MRELFLIDPDVTFLNHGSFGACPEPVFKKYQQWQRALELQPVEFLGRRYHDLISYALEQVGKYVGTSYENLVFVPNATTGLNVVARSLKLSPDDEILTTDHEYGALNLTWQYISRETGAKIVVQKLPDTFIDPMDVVEAIWAGVTPNTRFIFMSHITSVTALILPVEEICHRAREAGIITIIDGAHIPGHISLNLDEIGADFYSGNFHKWLCAPKGSALLYVAPEYHDWIDPLVISWGWDGDSLFERTSYQGTNDIAAYLTVPAAIEFQKKHDWDAIRHRCHNMVLDTTFRICAMFGITPVAMPRYIGQMAVAPLPPCNLETVKELLYDQYRVEVPITEHNGRQFVRISVQGYNTQADLDQLLFALMEIFTDVVVYNPFETT